MQTANHQQAPSPIAAAAGVEDATLQRLLVEHWEHVMTVSPTWATQLGDHRFDDQIELRTVTAMQALRVARNGFLARANAIASSALNARDQVTLALFKLDLEAAIASDACQFEEWKVAAGGASLLGEFSYMVEAHPRTSLQDARNLLARVTKVGWCDRRRNCQFAARPCRWARRRQTIHCAGVGAT